MRTDSHRLLLRPAAPGAPAPDNRLNGHVRQSRHLPANGPAGAAESPYLDGPAGALASFCAFDLLAGRNSLVSV